MEYISTLILTGLLAIILVLWLLKNVRSLLADKSPPGPRGWPIVGNTFQLELKKLQEALWNHKETYGDVSYVKVGLNKIVSINSIEALNEVLKHHDYSAIFGGRPKTFLSTYIAPSAVSQMPYNDKWKKIRQLVSTLIKPYAHELREIELVVTTELAVLREHLESKGTVPFDIHEDITQSITNIIYIMMIGERFDYSHEIHKVQRKTDLALLQLISPYVNGVLSQFPFLRFFNFGLGAIYQEGLKNLEIVLKHLYYKPKAAYNFTDKKGFLYELLRKQRENPWLTDDIVRENVINMLLAGINTTTTNLYALCLILIYRPDVQRKIQEEIDDVIGREREPCLDDRVNMPYTMAVIFEQLRYCTLVPQILRSTMQDVVYRQFNIKKGTIIWGNIWRVHHDPELWADPWEFKPERFLDENGVILPPEHPNRRNFMVFGAGVRHCIGEVFARMRMFLFVTYLCQYFTIYCDDMENLSSMDPREYLAYFALNPKPYKLQLAKRE